ncbi:MAG: class I SAM-dependent rRNA methyltransferase [Pseudomonadota bacterium]
MTRIHPVIRLKPKTRPQAIRDGFPWVYDNELVTDRRTRALARGSLAVLEDAGRAALGLVAVNPASRIMARVLDSDPAAVIDQAWFAQRLAQAEGLRTRLYDAPYYRLIHAEADGLPGVVIDRFDDTAVIQPNAAWAEQHLEDLTAALLATTDVRNVLKNASGRARALEGLDDRGGLLAGAAPAGAVEVPMNGAIYLADLVGGQKTGLFYDQRPNHAFAACLARDARVLDVFSHVGGFALATLAGGARSALAVDGSDAALTLARVGADRTGHGAGFDTRQGDAFAVMAGLADAGETFDLVICDPPAFAPSRKALEPGLRAYEKTARLAASLVGEGGFLCLCSCSHAAGLDSFRKASLRGISRAGRAGLLIHTGGAGPDHPLHPHLAASGYLKALFFRL